MMNYFFQSCILLALLLMAVAIPFTLGGKIVSTISKGIGRYGGKVAGMTPWGKRAQVGWAGYQEKRAIKAQQRIGAGKGLAGKLTPKSTRERALVEGLEKGGIPTNIQRMSVKGRNHDAQRAYKELFGNYQNAGGDLAKLNPAFWNEPDAIAALDSGGSQLAGLVQNGSMGTQNNLARTLDTTGQRSYMPWYRADEKEVAAGATRLETQKRAMYTPNSYLDRLKSAANNTERHAIKAHNRAEMDRRKPVELRDFDKNMVNDSHIFEVSGLKYIKPDQIGVPGGESNLFSGEGNTQFKQGVVAAAQTNGFADPSTNRAILDSAKQAGFNV